MKKFILFFALSMVMSVTVRAQLCDFTDLFHYGMSGCYRTEFLNIYPCVSLYWGF